MPAKKLPPGFVPADVPSPKTDNAGGEAYLPDLGSTIRVAPLTMVDPCAPFLLKAHPERWTVMGGKVVPSFGRLVMQSGVDGVEGRKGGKLDLGTARNMNEERGWTLIPPDAVPDSHATTDANGNKVKSYLYRPTGRPDVTLLIYTKVFPGSKQVEVDVPRYVEFCEHLIASGVIEGPKVYALEKLRARMEHEAAELGNRARQFAQYAPAAKSAADALAVVTAEVERLRAAPVGGEAVEVEL